MRVSVVNAAIMRVIGKLEQKNARNKNCVHWGSTFYWVLLYTYIYIQYRCAILAYTSYCVPPDHA